MDWLSVFSNRSGEPGVEPTILEEEVVNSNLVYTAISYPMWIQMIRMQPRLEPT
jgi:hypothetical protein